MDIFDTHQTLFIEVLLPLNLNKSFTYRVPFERNDEVMIGKRVTVPFGRNKIYAGLILSVDSEPPQEYEAKYIHDVIDDTPIISEEQIKFWRWISLYYMSSLGSVLNAALPAGLKMEGESKVMLHPEFSWNHNEFTDEEVKLLQILENYLEISIIELTKASSISRIHRHLKSLYLKGCILIKDEATPSFSSKKESFVRLADPYKDEALLSELFTALEKKASKQLESLMVYVSYFMELDEVSMKDLQNRGANRDAVKALVSKGVFTMEKKEVSRIEHLSSTKAELKLSSGQKEALQEIKRHFNDQKNCLLHGVTSSGKTLIYTTLIKEALEAKKQILYLLPEIALTSQLVDRLAAYFGESMVVSHSKFSNNERVEIFYKIQSGEPLLILGTRSAVFHPFRDLGLIIVDEEHESSFKQQEPAPRFHAKDVALYLGKMLKCPVLLGSATPSFESYYNALSGKYGLVSLEQRFDDAHLPQVHIVDMLQQKRQKRNSGIFSDTLLEAILEAKKDGKQTILFQNKKGYVPVLECTQCSWTPHCINCDISLTYYKFQNNLRCHYCGYTRPVVHQCAQCGHNGLELIGHGTERIEDELNLFAPDLRTQRLDYNSTRLKSSHKKIIQQFAKGEIDVLIGTQMIAKGLDFNNVRIVGILNADHLLNFPDFRAHERAFQLMTQVAGRAGRRSEQGHVYIQSSKVNHSILQHVAEHDFKGMYDVEMNEREAFHYPPFNRLIKLTFKHKDALELHKSCVEARRLFNEVFGQNMLGPEKPYVGKIRNWYLMNFLLKLPNDPKELSVAKSSLYRLIQQLEQLPQLKGSRILVDVDPI